MSTTRHFVYWTIYPNTHQRAWIDELRAEGCDIEVCYFGHYDAYRTDMGWREPKTLPKQEHFFSTLQEARHQILDYAQRTAILTGYHDKIYWEVLHFCETQNLPWVFFAEGSQGRWRSLWQRRLFAHHVNRSALHAFAIGSSGVADFIDGWGIDPDKVSQLPYVTPRAEHPTVPLPHSEYRFVFVGAFIYRKAIDVLADAWRQFAPTHPNAVLRIIGDGPLRSCFDGLPRVERCGVLPPERIAEQFVDCDCGLLPSRFDGWGMVLAEYVRAGLTLIGTDRCGASETLIRPGRNGYIIPAAELSALVQALEDVPLLVADSAVLTATSAKTCVHTFLSTIENGIKEAHAQSFVHIAAGCWKDGGGLSESVALTALHQARRGYRVTLAFLGGAEEHPLLRECRRAGVTIHVFPRTGSKSFYFSWTMLLQLRTLIRQSSRVYLHGCWTFPIFWGARCAHRTGVPYFCSPHGALNLVYRRYGRIRKWVAWVLFNRHALLGATALHACSETEAQTLREVLRAPCPPIRIIPNAVNGAELDAVAEQSRTQTFLFLGRLHPLKGLDLLAEAWRIANLTTWTLAIAGTNEGVHLPLAPRMHLLGALHGEAKVRALKSAACLILPTRSENFGMVVAEALWCRTPVICTKGAPWSELGDFWVDITAEALADAMRRMAALTDSERDARFAPLFDVAHERFSPSKIAAILAE